MMGLAARNDVIEHLQKEVLLLQRGKRSHENSSFNSGLGSIEMVFPDRTFPLGAVHEFLSYRPEDAASTNAFISGILSRLMRHKGQCLWIGSKRLVFPPALARLGIEPHRIIFIDLARPKDVLWTIEEALKCDALSAVVGELGELSFKESRRLQLAVEASNVTGFIHRHNPRCENAVASVARWRITPLASVTADAMPGLGLSRWSVELLKVRNGKPGIWQIEWANGGFEESRARTFFLPIQTRKTG